jgi:membrane-bound ClpP family serine protease
MKIMDAKVSGISVKVEESVEYTRDIKNGLRSDILNIEKQSDRVEDTVRIIEDNVDNLLREYEAKVRKLMDSNMSDTRTLIDNADKRFENQRERVRISQNSEMKELEEKLIDKLQRALDNPLAD